MRVGGKHRQYTEEGETNELMSESYSRRSWKGIAIAFLVIGAVAALVTLIVIYSGSQTPWYIEGTLTLSDVTNGKYSPKTFGSTVWYNNDSVLFLDNNNLKSFSIPDNTTTIIVHSDAWKSPFDSFYPSPSGEYILYSYNRTKHFRYTYNASFQVLKPYNYHANDTKYDIADGKLLQYASWGSGDKIVYVYKNNIYYLNSVDGTETNVTTDGDPDRIFNGVPDWVYEEEVLGTDNAIWWSPDGRYFAFMKFDDSNVKDMYFVKYGNYDQYYPKLVDIKYPKPGTPNPEVSVWVYDTTNTSGGPVSVRFEPADNSSHYVTSVTWANNKVLSVMWGPRIQNQSSVSLCSVSTSGNDWSCTVDSKETSEGWLETRVPYFSQNGSLYFLLKSNQKYKHIYMNVVSNPRASIFLTNGTYEVTSIVYYNNNTLYYIRTDPDHAERRRFYRMSMIPDKMVEKCLSDKDDCDWASVSVSPSGKYYALTCSSPTTVPTVEIYSMENDSHVVTWETNQDLKDKLSNQTLTDYLDFSCLANLSNPSEGKIKIRVFVPKNFTKTRKYPAVIYVYGGPGSQMIQNNFGIDFGTYLVTNKNYLYIEVDGRGSGFRGDDILFKLYKRLGTVEIEDQISAMRYLLRNHSFVDPNRVAIWGWSYGGYAAAMTLAKGKDIFTCAMSVAPVTNWHYYDSVYTERYMLEPKDNLEGYRSSAVTNYVSNFRASTFLLLHGTADDNVHIQQTMMLTTALNNASILFDMHIYPDENHSIPKSKLHVYMTLEDFLANCFS